ncbi:MAG: benzoate/H(+) symporter BenE family transporter [Alphaproteobacteria bacterium]
MIAEKFPRPLPRLGEMLRAYRGHHLAIGIVSFLFASTGPVAIIVSVCLARGLKEEDIASWLLIGFALSGIFTVVLSIGYRMPLAIGWTIPGSVLVDPKISGQLSFPEVLGACMAAGAVILVLGLSGLVKRAMNAIPMPLVMAMIAGIFLNFGIGIVKAFDQTFWVAFATLAGFIVFTLLPRIGRYCPPVFAALIAGAVVCVATGQYKPSGEMTALIALPKFYMPEFSLQGMIELVIPMTVAVLVLQNANGLTILKAAGFDPPTNTVTNLCGVGSIVYASMGSVNTCLTGPVNAILTASGDKETHYLGGVTWGIFAILFGLFGPLMTKLMVGLPSAFIMILGGLALLRVLQASFVQAFRDKFTLGALVVFLVTVSDLRIFNIGPAFWGLVFGLATSWLMERKDFETPEPAAK